MIFISFFGPMIPAVERPQFFKVSFVLQVDIFTKHKLDLCLLGQQIPFAFFITGHCFKIKIPLETLPLVEATDSPPPPSPLHP